ncbi:MAG: LacI family DNA-binding transcriptional regulator [Chthoniobacteraceae bacterium]
MAQHLGLSEWTVSRAINGHPEVKAATRERILKAMDELGFRPNPVARKLSGKQMGIVGVCVVNAHSRVIIDKIRFLDKFLKQHGIRAILSLASREKERELKTIRDFLHLRVDGVVLFQSTLDVPSLNKTLGNVSCVLVDPEASFAPRVWLDRGEAMRLIVQHLFELGHRSFGLLGISPIDKFRWAGLIKAFADYGVNFEKSVQVFGIEKGMGDSYSDGVLLARRAVAAKKRATAYIALNDEIAIGSLPIFREAGLRAPEDFSIVGFDNLPAGMYLQPSLTTIDQQVDLMITSAGELLLEELGLKEKTDSSRCVKIPPKIIIRGSTGPAPRRTKK